MKFQYTEATQAIENWITKQKVAPGERLPSARVLAPQIGFSKEATERACLILISRGLLCRMGYKLILQADTQKHANPIGIVYIVSYWSGFIKTTGRLLTERGIKFRGIDLHPVNNKNPLPALHKLLAEKPAGIILWMPYWLDELKALESEPIPIVICTNGAPLNVNLNLCEIAEYRGMEMAIRHLQELGHRQIACLTAYNDFRTLEYYSKVCLQLDLKQSARAIWGSKSNSDKGYRQTINQERVRHPEVTAIVGLGLRIAEFKKETIQCLKGLSVIGVYDHINKGQFSITRVGVQTDSVETSLWACSQIIFRIQNHESGHLNDLKHRIMVIPQLIVGNSTQPLLEKKQNLKTIAPNTKLLDPADTWRKSYPFLKNKDTQWRSLNLAKLANHSMTRENGWLGRTPLLHFDPGLRTIHGIPFQVIDQALNGGHAVITFRSPHTHSMGHERLPVRVKLPVNRVIKALYFLHGCGWANWQRPFAEYIIHFKNGKSTAIPLIPIGPTKDKRHARFKPNIHDWWRVEEAQDFPQAMSVTVYNPAIPKEYERVLYTLEWINPEPSEEVCSIEIQVNPKAGPALALIAVTSLL